MDARKLNEITLYYQLVTNYVTRLSDGNKNDLKDTIKFINSKLGGKIKLNISGESMEYAIEEVASVGHKLLTEYYMEELDNIEFSEAQFYKVDAIIGAYHSTPELTNKLLKHPNIPLEIYKKNFEYDVNASLNNPVLSLLLLEDTDFYKKLIHYNWQINKISSCLNFLTLNGESYMNHIEKYIANKPKNTIINNEISRFEKYKNDAILLKKHNAKVTYVNYYSTNVEVYGCIYKCNAYVIDDFMKDIKRDIEDHLMSELMLEIDNLFADNSDIVGADLTAEVADNDEYLGDDNDCECSHKWQFYLNNDEFRDIMLLCIYSMFNNESCDYDSEFNVITITTLSNERDKHKTPILIWELLNEWKYRDYIELLSEDYNE